MWTAVTTHGTRNDQADVQVSRAHRVNAAHCGNGLSGNLRNIRPTSSWEYRDQ
jgi:hypothetical protein